MLTNRNQGKNLKRRLLSFSLETKMDKINWSNDCLVSSSIGDGGSGALLRNCARTKSHPYTTFPFNGKLNGSIKWFLYLRSYFCARILKLYVFPIESAFKYLHQLNRNESSNGFYILRSHFKFTYSVAFSENYGSVAFSENRKSMMSFHRDRGMSHQIAIIYLLIKFVSKVCE